MSGLSQPLSRAGRSSDQKLVQSPRRSIKPRAEQRHAPGLDDVRVELEDGQGVVHPGQICDLSFSGALLRFSRPALAAAEGLATTLRVYSRSGSEVLDLSVEVRWTTQAQGSCRVGVRFAQPQGSSPFLQDLLLA